MSNGDGGGKLARMIQPQDFEGAFAMATRLCLSELIPRGFKPKFKQNMTPLERTQAIEVAASSIVIAWEMGAELGLSPMMALQSIAVINGKPNLYGETPLAVVMASGKLEYIKESLDEDKKVQTCEVKRVGMDQPVIRTFSMREADEAELWEAGSDGSPGKWMKLSARPTYRSWWRDMLMYRARGRVLKALFPDVLKGIEIQEASLETGVDEPGAGVVIDAVAEEVNPFASQQKEPVASGGVGGVQPADAPAPSEPGAAVPPPEPAKRRPKKVVPEPAVEVVDPVCPNVRPEDGARCTGPTGHEGACLFPVQEPATAAVGPQEGGGVVLGSEDCDVEGCWQGKGHPGPHVFAPAQEGPPTPPSSRGPGLATTPPPPPPDVTPVGPTEFTLFGKFYRTAGMTSEQMAESYELATKVDKSALGKGYARGLLAKLMRVPVAEATRLNLTEEKAEQYLKALRQAAAAPAQAELSE